MYHIKPMTRIQFSKELFNDNNKMDKLEVYVELAKKLISLYGGTFKRMMLESDDIISDLSTYLMLGDWRYRGINSDILRKGYRFEFGRWAIGRLKKSIYQEQRINKVDISELYNFRGGKFYREERDNRRIKDMADEMISCKFLKPYQKSYLYDYFYNNMTYQEIANKNGCSKQNVQQLMARAIDVLKTVYN